jgi:UDP-glucuronate decarboxylase
MVIKITGSKSKIKFTTRPGHDHQRRKPDLTKIKKLGWKRKITLMEGLKFTFARYNFKK